eukprot:TRINITY_DN10040_c0_g1_i1.p1 TRINITY_DN10040_c0_g1~~TRINITY_DN10040_c0_g1_i1.p1  ORF type:complete len:608 (+),score=60.79 TRINITY_DN10040_c0_g1_i1:58-1881(+)
MASSFEAPPICPLFDSEILSDVLVVTPSSKSFRCHKCILALRSEFFRSCFTSNWADSSLVELQFPDPYDILPDVLRYFYGHSLEVTVENWAAFYSAASQLICDDLLSHLSKFFSRQVSSAPVALLLAASRFSDTNKKREIDEKSPSYGENFLEEKTSAETAIPDDHFVERCIEEILKKWQVHLVDGLLDLPFPTFLQLVSQPSAERSDPKLSERVAALILDYLNHHPQLEVDSQRVLLNCAPRCSPSDAPKLLIRARYLHASALGEVCITTIAEHFMSIPDEVTRSYRNLECEEFLAILRHPFLSLTDSQMCQHILEFLSQSTTRQQPAPPTSHQIRALLSCLNWLMVKPSDIEQAFAHPVVRQEALDLLAHASVSRLVGKHVLPSQHVYEPVSVAAHLSRIKPVSEWRTIRSAAIPLNQGIQSYAFAEIPPAGIWAWAVALPAQTPFQPQYYSTYDESFYDGSFENGYNDRRSTKQKRAAQKQEAYLGLASSVDALSNSALQQRGNRVIILGPNTGQLIVDGVRSVSPIIGYPTATSYLFVLDTERGVCGVADSKRSWIGIAFQNLPRQTWYPVVYAPGAQLEAVNSDTLVKFRLDRDTVLQNLRS